MESVATREEDNNRYFAISPQGEVAFIYTDTLNNQAAGSYYMSCPDGCTDLDNWTQTTLSTTLLVNQPSLAFSKQGNPRIACGIFLEDTCSAMATAPIPPIGLQRSSERSTAQPLTVCA
jgi:hypothetical protein